MRRGWGLLPLAFVLLCVALVAAIQAVTGDTLRSVPRMVLVCMGVCSFGVALLWANIRLIFADIPLRVLSVLLKFATPVLSFVLFCYIVLGTVVFVAFSYCP